MFDRARRHDPERTRAELLDAAFAEIYRNGFQAASLGAILRRAGVTKGALYHHFENKRELGYAVVDEVVRPWMEERFLAPFEDGRDPIDVLVAIAEELGGPSAEKAARYGCPLNNLAQEMSPIDEGFRRRVNAAFERWRAGLAAHLAAGKERGQVDPSVDEHEAATFIVAVIQGSTGMVKNSQDINVFATTNRALVQYLESLRPAAAEGDDGR